MFVPLGQIFLTYKTHRGGRKTFMTHRGGANIFTLRGNGVGGGTNIFKLRGGDKDCYTEGQVVP